MVSHESIRSVKPGLTLIEILIVIFIGMLLTTSVGWLIRREPAVRVFIRDLNNLVLETAEKARTKNTVFKVHFRLAQKEVVASQLSPEKVVGKIEIPSSVELQDFLIDGKTQFTGGGAKLSAYFYINPDGITQDVILVFLDHELKDKPGARGGVYRLQLNPFTAQFLRI